MVVTDPPRDVYRAARWIPRRMPGIAIPTIEILPLLITGAVLAGLTLVTVTTPIAGRGDYGQWLMTSRYYLGENVPDYRVITALPPVVPGLLAAVRVMVPDPVAALHVINTLLLAGVGIGFYLTGTLVLGSRWVGAFSAVIGLLVTDRFLELFAFGGLLQAASMSCMCLSVAAFARAGREDRVVRRWWLLGTVAMALAAFAHVGTGTIAVPTGLAAAALSAIGLRRLGWQPLTLALLPLVVAVAGVAGYWLLVLLPASADYLTNPASLAYRGPDRLFSVLLSYVPTTIVLVVGIAAMAVGAIGEIARRRIGGYLYLLAWAGVTWGTLTLSVVSGAATDYPRFATLLLAPLVVAAGAAVMWVLVRVAIRLRESNRRIPGGILPAAVLVATTMVAAPLTVGRYERQVGVYQPRDAQSLTAAVEWLDGGLSNEEAVLTEVRDGKWVEGLTGHEALFSQPVRYAFRPTEWQRSRDADALLRSTQTLTSGYVAAQFIGRTGPGADGVPTELLLRGNHGGEFVDLLRVPAKEILIAGDGPTVAAATLVPVRATQRETDRQASIRTVWSQSADSGFSYTQTVTAFRDGTTLRLIQSAPDHRLSIKLVPAFGIAITSLEIDGSEAIACFTELGGSEPCVRVHATQAGARLTEAPDGGLRVESGNSGRIDLLITALTAGRASTGLGVLEPMEVVEGYDVGAALLYQPDPAYPARLHRLEALGFEEARAFGPYRVLLRQAPGSP